MSLSEHAAYMREWRRTHPEYRISQRENLRRFRQLNPDYDRNWKRNNPTWREKHQEQMKCYRQNHPERMHARNKARWVPIGEKCAICGATDHLERHHPDYSKPDVVITLCKRCHVNVHKE